MSGQNFSAGLRPAVCLGAQKSRFGGSKWCSSDFERIVKRFLGILGFSPLDFCLVSDAVVWGHWSGVTGGGSPPPAKCINNVGNMLGLSFALFTVGSEVVRVAHVLSSEWRTLFAYELGPFFARARSAFEWHPREMLSLARRLAPRAEATRWRTSARAGRAEAHP